MMRYRPSAAPAILLAMLALCTAGVGSASGEEIDKLMAAFLEKPERTNYLRVFEAVTSGPQYDPYSSELDEIYDLTEKRDFKAAQSRLEAAMPNLLLSPRAHLMARRVAEGLGDADEARRQDEIAKKCVEGILSTGRGDSPASPYLVTRTTDEYDVLRALKRQTSFQALRSFGGRYYDVFRYGGGKEVWFDITVPYETLTKRVKKE